MTIPKRRRRPKTEQAMPTETMERKPTGGPREKLPDATERVVRVKPAKCPACGRPGDESKYLHNTRQPIVHGNTTTTHQVLQCKCGQRWVRVRVTETVN